MISIIIPCYNEEANLERGVLSQVVTFLELQPYEWEVIIVDDGSTDRSLELCEQFVSQNTNFKIIHLSHGGKPHAIFGGLQDAKGEIVLFTDMDQSTPINELDKLLVWFEKGHDVVIGSRGLQRDGFSLTRQITSWGFRIIRGLILLPKIKDTQCGFKAFRSSVAKEIFPLLSFFTSQRNSKGWIVSAFDVELLFIADKWGFQIKEVEVEWQHRDESTTKGKQGGKFFRESIEMAQEILNVVWNNIRGRYKKYLLSSSSVKKTK